MMKTYVYHLLMTLESLRSEKSLIDLFIDAAPAGTGAEHRHCAWDRDHG